MRGSIERTKCEMQRLSEDLYTARVESSSLKDDLRVLEDGVEIANKNSGALQVSLSKLKSKVGTHRARAAGAVCDLLSSNPR